MDLIETSPDELTDSLAFALLRQRKALQRFAQRAGHEPGMGRLPSDRESPGRTSKADRGGEEPAAAIHVPQVPVIVDPDIFRAAKLMIDQHGDEASRRAERRANDLEKGRDSGGCAIWRQIVTAIEELQRGRRDNEALN